MSELTIIVDQDVVTVAVNEQDVTVSMESTPIVLSIEGIVIEGQKGDKGDPGENVYVFTTPEQYIDDSYESGFKMIPFGETQITARIDTENKGGLVMRGHGTGINTSPAHSLMGSRSSIHWASAAATDAMLRIRGARVVIRDVGFYGDVYNPSTGQFDLHGGLPDAGILVSANQGGDANTTGSGKHSIENCFFYKLKSAIAAGELVGDNNCDMTRVTNCSAHYCENVFRSENIQAMAWTFDHGLYSNFTSTLANRRAFYIKGGGILRVNDFTYGPGRILTLDQVQSPSGFGSNNSGYLFDFNNIDDNAGTDSIHLDVVDRAAVNDTAIDVTFRELWHRGTLVDYVAENKRCAYIRGRTTLRYEGGKFVPNLTGAFEWHNLGTGLATLMFINVRIRHITGILQLLATSASEGDLHVVSWKCRKSDGTFLPDIDQVVSGTA